MRLIEFGCKKGRRMASARLVGGLGKKIGSRARVYGSKRGNFRKPLQDKYLQTFAAF
ncbi:hypothetical protein [Paraburkholderia sp. CNPSo 3281]|uniref:hypothetical protein n=1 Tax=Paraburkholderia sp. CNPSo 3281 TaxID=2940933 RepID=UPI0020B88D0A|nr:hypothetical protein [Paraburkholderia sp. CNPSo 3281]MCP3720896.1 hypothetical protein [Paraburkholderia sp. CNPSo 3281]